MNSVGSNEVCRICAKPSEKGSVNTPLFELSGPIKCVSKDILEIIEMFQLNCKQNDGLPQEICFSCLKTLAVISEFRKRCEDVQKILSFYHKSAQQTSIRKKARSHYAEKIERLKKANIASGYENLENVNYEERKQSYAEKLERIKMANIASGVEKSEDVILEEIKMEEEVPEVRAPFWNGRQLSNKDDSSTRGSAVVYLKRIKMTNFELTNANVGNEGNNKQNSAADNGSDACGNRIANSGQVSINSKANKIITKKDLDLVGENLGYGLEKTDIEFIDEAFINGISSEDDVEELNINDTNWQCEFSIDSNDADGEELPSGNTIEKATSTKKRKRKPKAKQEKSQCPYCLKFYQVMIHHLRSCSARTCHICKYCDLAFETSTELNEHVEKMHPEGLPACYICFATFDNIQLRGAHVRKEHNKVEFKCEKCDRVFRSKLMFDEHMERRHTEKINKKCDLCNKVIKTEFLFRRHLKQHEMADQLKCKFCGKMFTRMQFKLNHERVHTGETPFLCEFCGLGFAALVDLNSHKRCTHLRDENAEKDFRPRKRKWSAYALKKPVEPRRFKCALCPRDFGTSYGLDNHLKMHTEDRKYVCEQCGNGFHRLVHLKMHERRMHTKVKRFSCPKCGKMFYEKHELNFHMPVHQEERPLKCPHCPARFKLQKRLKSHLAKHSTAKPYVCQCCGTAYKFSTNLQAHIQTHTEAEIKEIERKLLCDMEKSIEANRIFKIEEENMIEEESMIEEENLIEEENMLKEENMIEESESEQIEFDFITEI